MAFSESDLRSMVSGMGYSQVEGLREVKEALSIVEGTILAAAANGTKKQALELKKWSQEICPYFNGILHDSAKVKAEESGLTVDEGDTRMWSVRSITLRGAGGKSYTAHRYTLNWQVSYDADHAWMLHDNPLNWTIQPNGSAKAPPGGIRQDHYLENARNAMAVKYKDFMQSELKTAVIQQDFAALRAARGGGKPLTQKVSAEVIAETISVVGRDIAFVKAGPTLRRR